MKNGKGRYQLLIAETKKVCIYLFADANDVALDRANKLPKHYIKQFGIEDADNLNFEWVYTSNKSAEDAFWEGLSKHLERKRAESALNAECKTKKKPFCMTSLSKDYAFIDEVVAVYEMLISIKSEQNKEGKVC